MNSEEVKKSIINSFDMGINSHAFLLVTNNIDATYSEVLDVVKKINCKTKEEYCTCNICNSINKSTNPDVIEIKTEGREIKKDDILNLIYRFSTKPLINKYSCYIIKNADKLNLSSANKLLKFLEEPEGNIVGFYITDSLNSILPTIKSRCLIYNVKYGNDNLLDVLNINEEIFDKYYDIAFDLTNKLNLENKYELMMLSKTYSSKERIDIDRILYIVQQMYIIKFEFLTSDKYDSVNYIKPILKNIKTNDIKIIVKRINLLDNIINDFKMNVNKDLFINKLFVSWE